MKSAADGARKWADRTASATEEFKAGVGRVTESPGAKAAASADIWSARVSSGAAKEKFTRRSSQVGIGEWKAATQGKADRLASGARDAQPKYQKVASTLYPHIEAGVGSLPPKTGTLEGGIARATAMIRHNASYKG